jgi:hypothetical protein
MTERNDVEMRGQANRDLIDALRRSKLFRDYERVFAQATGLPLVLRAREYWQLAHHGKKNENPFALFWRKIRRRLPFVCRPMTK